MEKLIKSQNGQWALVKAAPKLDMGHSVFTMDHVREVSGMKDHAKAKEYAHGIVDASNAHERNKSSIKHMIDKSRNVKDLVFGMSNHVLAHPSEGLRVISSARKAEDSDEAAQEKTEKSQMAKEEGSEMMFSDLEQIAHHIAEIREHMKASEDSPDWVKAQITEAAQNLSGVAHYIPGKKAKVK